MQREGKPRERRRAREQGELVGPQRDVEEEERDLGRVEDPGRRRLRRDAIAKLVRREADMALPQAVLPRVDAGQDHAGEPGEEHEAVREVAGPRLRSGFLAARPEAKDDGDQGQDHARLVDSYERVRNGVKLRPEVVR